MWQKGLKLKVRKFLGLIRTFVEVTREKLVWGTFSKKFRTYEGITSLMLFSEECNP